MAAKIGILGESTSVTRATTVTLYTVPADKAARVKIQYAVEGAAATDGTRIIITVGSPGTEKTISWNSGAVGRDMWTGKALNTTPDPALSVTSLNGAFELLGGMSDMDSETSVTHEFIVSPLEEGYFLSTGDTVKRRFQSDAIDPIDALVQVVGVEDDA